MCVHVCVCQHSLFECYILNTHMYCLIAMNDLVCSLKGVEESPHSLQLTLFYEQTMTKKMNHNLLNISVCARACFKCVCVSGRVNQPIGRGSTLGRAFIPSQIKCYIKHGFKSYPRGLLKKISTPHIPDPESFQFWERLPPSPLSCYSTD